MTNFVDGTSCCYCLLKVGSLYAVHTLCECGADPRAVDQAGQTTLHHAAKCGAV